MMPRPHLTVSICLLYFSFLFLVSCFFSNFFLQLHRAEREKLEYGEKLKRKFHEFPEVRSISEHRQLSDAVSYSFHPPSPPLLLSIPLSLSLTLLRATERRRSVDKRCSRRRRRERRPSSVSPRMRRRPNRSHAECCPTTLCWLMRSKWLKYLNGEREGREGGRGREREGKGGRGRGREREGKREGGCLIAIIVRWLKRNKWLQ